MYVPHCDEKEFKSPSPEKCEVVYKSLTKPCKFSTFFHAANLVRKNYDQWKEFSKKPTQPPPQVFQGYFEDKVLVLFLLYSEVLKIFNFDPCDPFFFCEKQNATDYVAPFEDGNVFKNTDTLKHLKYVLNLWISFDCPGKETHFGKHLTNLSNTVKESNDPEVYRGKSVYSLGDLWHDMSFEFNFPLSINVEEGGGVLIDMPVFVEQITVIIAFDAPGAVTLETFRELFPQFPELVSSAVGEYYLTISDPIWPYYEKLFDFDRLKFLLGRKVLQEKFNCVVNYETVRENPPLRNQNALSMIEAHPELFVWWATDPKLSKLYRELVETKVLQKQV